MRRLGQLGRAARGEDGIDIGPLIDIIFILLIFFMVSTTFVRSHQLGIERPSASSAQPADVRAIRVTVTQQGEVFLDGQAVEPWMLQSRVRSLLGVDARRPVLVTGDSRLASGRLVDIVDRCRLAGAQNVAVDVVKGRGG